MAIKYENQETNDFSGLSPQDMEDELFKDEEEELEEEELEEEEDQELPSPPPTPPPPSKKRRRGKSTADNNDENKTPACAEKGGTAPKQVKQRPVKKEPSKTVETEPTKKKRGAHSVFTAEEDAYLCHLRSYLKRGEEIHAAFEAKFNSGVNAKSLKNRWFKIKDAVLLTGEEDKALTETIEAVMGDLAGMVVEKFKEKSGKKVTRGFVQKKMKEGGHGVGGAGAGKGKIDEEDE
ncbi:hypothetical protein AA313_de0208102 [Arthrobotrys entomopaga]|nr:hypothetical protein AA313_de0208102 [Arthrobotrys entomopaga]